MKDTHPEIGAVRAELWALYRDLREDEIGTEAAEVAVQILDTQVRLIEAEADLEDKGHQGRRHPDVEALHDGG